MSTNLLDSPALGAARWNTRTVCALTLALVFLCGGVLGAVAMDFVVHGRQRPPAFDTPSGKAQYFDHLKQELNLSPAQAEQMESILNDLWFNYRSFLNDSTLRVEQLLTPEQRVKFQQILKEQKR